jgi:hypothetical protein
VARALRLLIEINICRYQELAERLLDPASPSSALIIKLGLAGRLIHRCLGFETN